MTKKKNPIAIYMAKIGSKGGQASGRRKARSSKQARRAAQARWTKHKP